jgi:hypothetical protein
VAPKRKRLCDAGSSLVTYRSMILRLTSIFLIFPGDSKVSKKSKSNIIPVTGRGGP